MATKDVLKKKALERDEPLESLIPRLLNELGTMYAVAVELGVYPNTILHWLSTHNYRYDPQEKKWVQRPNGESSAQVA